MVYSVECPRCKGSGRIQLFHPDRFGKKVLVKGDCPVCRGSGMASMMEKMGSRLHEDKREKDG